MFQELFNMMSQGQLLTISLSRQGDKLAVCVLPRCEHLKDEAKNHLTPLTLTGTPQELDEGFIRTIGEPVQRVSGMLTNMLDFEEKADKAAAESKALKEKTEKVKKLMKEAEGLEKDKPQEALALYKQALELDKNNTKIRNKITSLDIRVSQGSLFGATPPVQPVTSVTNVEAETVPAGGQPPVQAVTVDTTTEADQQPPIDMFAQIVNKKIGEGEKVQGTQPVAANENTGIPAIDPDTLKRFLEFQAYEAQKVKQQ